MSLINDALKKAQKAHSGDKAQPPPIGQSGSASHSMGKSQLVKIFFAAVIVLGIFGSAIAFLVVGLISDDEKEPSSTPMAVASTSTEPEPAQSDPITQDVVPVKEPEPAKPLPTPVANTTPTPIEPIAQSAPPPKNPEPVPAQAQPKETPKAPLKGFALVRQTVAKGSANADIVDSVVESVDKTPQPAAQIPVQPTVSAPPPVVVTPKPVARTQPIPSARPQPSTSSTAPTQNPVILEYIEKMVIQGVRLSGTNSKVLMDNKVFRLNSFVNRDLKLRVISINKERIIFSDHAGVQYAKFY